ncbi:acyltransferase [Williamsia sp. D3]|uniref:acyltransferase family protein n=1 Tax=Williamsia sp. D3 TaxID=1313067 RepID=UPI0013788BE1
MTLGDFFNSRANSLNSLRLLFAALVIVSHSWPVGGFGSDPKLGDLKLGEFAVAAFFAISGFLITASKQRFNEKPGGTIRNDLVPYFRARVLRIFPGFWVCLVLTAFVAAPIAGAVRGGWSIDSAISYVVKNVTLLIRQWTVGDTLDGAPYPGAWNGPLWTLVYEFACYIMIAALFTIPPFRNRWVVLGVFAAFTLASIARHSDATPATDISTICCSAPTSSPAPPCTCFGNVSRRHRGSWSARSSFLWAPSWRVWAASSRRWVSRTRASGSQRSSPACLSSAWTAARSTSVMASTSTAGWCNSSLSSPVCTNTVSS